MIWDSIPDSRFHETFGGGWGGRDNFRSMGMGNVDVDVDVETDEMQKVFCRDFLWRDE
jgi:hypothetical protein